MLGICAFVVKERRKSVVHDAPNYNEEKNPSVNQLFFFGPTKLPKSCERGGGQLSPFIASRQPHVMRLCTGPVN